MDLLLVLIIAVPAGLLLWHLTKRFAVFSSHYLPYLAVGGLLLCVMLSLMVYGLGWGFAAHHPWLCIAIAVAYGFCFGVLGALRSNAWRKTLRWIFVLPLVPLYGVTGIGVMLGLLWSAPQSPFETHVMSPEHECTLTYFGMVATDSGFDIALYELKSARRVQVAQARVYQSNDNLNPPGTPTNCDQLYANYMKGLRR